MRINEGQSGFNRLSEVSMLFELMVYCIVSRVFAKVHGLFVRTILFQITWSFKLMLESHSVLLILSSSVVVYGVD